MSSIYAEIMEKLYGHDIWEGFIPDDVDDDVQGWNGTHSSLSNLPSQFAQQIVVDVGVWKGQSTITLANNMMVNAIDGVVLAVDTFLGSPEHWKQGSKLFDRVNGFPDLYRQFLSNVMRHGLKEYIIPIPQTSTSACDLLRSKGIRPTLIHVDAAHEYREVMNDIEDYWSILAQGGIMIGDDYHETWPGIVKAAGEFSAKIGKPLTVQPPKFILRK